VSAWGRKSSSSSNPPPDQFLSVPCASIPHMPWFTEDDLRAAAGDGSFQRARDYVSAVDDLRPTALGVKASVRGKDVYEVRLGRESGGLVGECECPYGLDGNFCKHCVAVGLALLATEPEAPPPDVATYLRSLSQDELVALLLEQANRDPGLCRQLTLRASATGAPQVAVLRRELDAALTVQDFTDKGYATRAKDALDTIEALTESGHAAEARPLARRAAERLAAALGAIEDPTGAVSAAARRAAKLYAKACAQTRPNPTKLATWLFDLRLAWTAWPPLDIADFAGPLGETGLKEYKRQIEEAWQSLPADADPTQLKGMREQFAKSTNDVDAMIEVLSEGLPAPKAYRDIVETLRRANRLQEAIHWAEEGEEKTRDVALCELLITCYLKANRAEEAVERRKAALREAPTRHCYACLKETATAADMWPSLRPWARAVLTKDPKELVGALLDDDAPEEAWQTAVTYDCVDVEIARLRAMTHPADVVPAYKALVESRLTRGGRDTYREAGVLLQELAKAATACDEPIEAYVASLKARNARRPALLDELRRAGF
jgi:uncharacterized Zn finger protein